MRCVVNRFPVRPWAAMRSKKGQSLVEYALILALVVMVAVLALTGFGAQTGQEMGNVVGAVGNAIGGPV
jgi:Flp pilus assembly pilin Flp